MSSMAKDWKQPKCPRLVQSVMRISHSEITCSHDKKEALYVLVQNHLHNLMVTEKAKVRRRMNGMLPFEEKKKKAFIYVCLFAHKLFLEGCTRKW